MELNVASSRVPITYFVVVLSLLSSFMAWAQSLDPDRVLASLAAFDDSIMNDFTLVADVVWPLTVLRPDSERAHERVRATRADSIWAYRADADEDTPTPNFEGIDPRSRKVDQGEALGSYVVSRRDSYSIFWEPDFSGYRERSKSMVVRPDGSITTSSNSGSDYVHITRPVGPLQNRKFYIPMLTFGRGYSMYLDKIDSAEPLPDGLILCKASGTYPGESRTACAWEMVIDPNAGYLVREAKAFRRRDGILMATFENEGVQWLEKGPVPETGRFRQSGERLLGTHYRGDGYTEITYLSLESGADHQLISDTRALLRGRYPRGTHVYDSRSDPTRTFRTSEFRKTRSIERAYRKAPTSRVR